MIDFSKEFIPKTPPPPRKRCRCGKLTSARNLRGQPECGECYVQLVADAADDSEN